MSAVRLAAIWVRLLAFVCCLGASPCLAAPHISDFSLGLSQEEMIHRKVSPCGDRLCGEVSFGGRDWGGVFVMGEKGLEGIFLLAPSSDDFVEAAFRELENLPYVLYRVISGQGCFDLAREAAGGLEAEELRAALTDFLAKSQGGEQTSATYFYTEPAAYAVLKKAAEAWKDAPPLVCPPEISLKDAPELSPEERKKAEEGVACCLNIDEQGVTFLIMSLSGLNDTLANGAKSPLVEH